MTDMTTILDNDTADANTPVWVAIPPGYVPLPLTEATERLDQARTMLTEVAEVDQRALIDAVTGALSALLSQLDATGALYCGIGRHTAPDDSIVTSSLVVSYLEFEGTRNPRLVLSDLVHAKADAGQHAQVDIIDVAERPMLFLERTRQLPTPHLPGQPELPDDATSPVFQLEAHIPSDAGDKLATIEFSTPHESQGPQFRAMVLAMASSLSFEPPAVSDDVSTKFEQVLG